MRRIKYAVRIGCACLLIFTAAGLVQSYNGANVNAFNNAAEIPDSQRNTYVEERQNTTVITTQGNKNPDNGIIVAFHPDGTVQYYNSTYDNYFDVDPVADTESSVSYVASERLAPSACNGKTCFLNVVEVTNLTTGSTVRLYSHIADGSWHDVDIVDSDRLLIADITADQVFIKNISSGIREWTWDAQSDFQISSGGVYPGDWTHVNDVEQLSDGRIMISLRNHDQVLFINQSSGEIDDALGQDDSHRILYEQHNPDYIKNSDGNSSVLVADSENNRIVEYSHRRGDWERIYQWSSERVQWPRDADRLPNGHTLITDSNGDRVIEINNQGEVVWSVSVVLPYEAERLETGPESSNAPTATEANLTTRDPSVLQPQETSGGVSIQSSVRSLIPGPIVNGIVFIIPPWMSFSDLLNIAISVFGLGVLIVCELRWSKIEINISSPVQITK